MVFGFCYCHFIAIVWFWFVIFLKVASLLPTHQPSHKFLRGEEKPRPHAVAARTGKGAWLDGDELE